MHLMEIGVILYVDLILFINHYLCMVLFVAPFTLLILNLKLLTAVQDQFIYLKLQLLKKENAEDVDNL